jgi:cold shock CspA family protein
MSDEGASHGTLVGRGAVKWFDPVKGYGFVEAPEHNGEILLHISPLRAFGLSSVAKAVEIEFEFEKTAKGARIVKVLDVIQPEASISVSDLTDEEFESLEPAIVKWFDASRGFGFVCLGPMKKCSFTAVLLKSLKFPMLSLVLGWQLVWIGRVNALQWPICLNGHRPQAKAENNCPLSNS